MPPLRKVAIVVSLSASLALSTPSTFHTSLKPATNRFNSASSFSSNGRLGDAPSPKALLARGGAAVVDENDPGPSFAESTISPFFLSPSPVAVVGRVRGRDTGPKYSQYANLPGNLNPDVFRISSSSAGVGSCITSASRAMPSKKSVKLHPTTRCLRRSSSTTSICDHMKRSLACVRPILLRLPTRPTESRKATQCSIPNHLAESLALYTLNKALRSEWCSRSTESTAGV
mmetsp:Transcript_2374/g.4205  ORF Transcript_2374/g.4205 Transcript_2374/m.4205 type:complete len:230 (-) Transcript_2374:1743-2432(-)